MSEWEEFRARRLRGEILMVLAQMPGERASATALLQVIGAGPVVAGLATIEAQMAWLSQAGYLVVEIRAGEMVAQITQRGSDLVERRETDPAIDLPRPRGA